jgi:hypothetical protein
MLHALGEQAILAKEVAERLVGCQVLGEGSGGVITIRVKG